MRFATVFVVAATASAQISLGGAVDSLLSITDAPEVSSTPVYANTTANATVDASTAAASAVASAGAGSTLLKRHGPDDDEEEEAAAAAIAANATAAIIVATPPIAINVGALAGIALAKRQDVGGVTTEITGNGINSCGSYRAGEQGEGDAGALGCDDPPPPDNVPANAQPASTTAPTPTPAPAPAPAPVPEANNGYNGQNGNSNGQGNLNQGQGNQNQGQGSNNGDQRPDRDDRPNRGGRNDPRPRPRPRPQQLRPRPRPVYVGPQPNNHDGLLGLSIGTGRGGLLGGGGLLGLGIKRDVNSAKFYHARKAAGQ